MEITSLRLAAVLAAATAFACGSKSTSPSTTPEAPARPATVLDAMPAGTAAVFRLDVQHLVRSKLWTQFAAGALKEGEAAELLAMLEQECNFDPVADLSEISMGLPASGESDDSTFVVRGRFDAAKLASCATAISAKKGATISVTTTGKISEINHDGETGYLGWIAADTLVIVPRAADGDKAALAWLDGSARATNDAALVELLGHVKPDQLLSGTSLVTGAFGDSLKIEGQPQPEAMWLNLAHHTGLELEFGARYATAEEAKASSDRINALVAEAGQNPAFGKYIASLRIEARERELAGVWELDEAQLDTLIAEIGPMIPLILGGMQ
jgi:hypothetical protein